MTEHRDVTAKTPDEWLLAEFDALSCSVHPVSEHPECVRFMVNRQVIDNHRRSMWELIEERHDDWAAQYFDEEWADAVRWPEHGDHLVGGLDSHEFVEIMKRALHP